MEAASRLGWGQGHLEMINPGCLQHWAHMSPHLLPSSPCLAQLSPLA